MMRRTGATTKSQSITPYCQHEEWWEAVKNGSHYEVPINYAILSTRGMMRSCEEREPLRSPNQLRHIVNTRNDEKLWRTGATTKSQSITPYCQHEEWWEAVKNGSHYEVPINYAILSTRGMMRSCEEREPLRSPNQLRHIVNTRNDEKLWRTGATTKSQSITPYCQHEGSVFQRGGTP